MPQRPFKVKAPFVMAGDQEKAVTELVEGIIHNKREQVLLGVTGSGKTFTMAKVIEQLNRPALIMVHNKTLAAQIYEEMKGFFPDNSVEYFVSYYDYYQPESYLPRTDTYIEKDSSINEQIDLLRHSATRSLLERRDVVVVASISCIYGLGAPEEYLKMTFTLCINQNIKIAQLIKQLIELQYERNDIEFERGVFRVKGDVLHIFPAHSADRAWRISFFGDQIEQISEFDPLTTKKIADLNEIMIFANSHFVTPRATIDRTIKQIKNDLKIRLNEFQNANKLIEAQRLEQRTMYDVEMLYESGLCKGIENYSRYLTGRAEGEPPPTLFEYLPKDALLFVDESHVAVPQIYGMYNGDRSRKSTLVEYGFRLPSALDNRPLRFEEWNKMRPPTIFVSATPGKFELEQTSGEFVEQVIRPTGLVDPVCVVRPVTNQIDDLLHEIKLCCAKDQRVLVTTLTKKMAENLAEYLKEAGIKVTYLHSEILTLERIQIIQDLRRGIFEVLVGVNLLREGLDIPECALVAILDADKEGFLRSEMALIQTIGRAARHLEGKVILYADRNTGSLQRALAETERRRNIQLEYNKIHNIKPTSIVKSIKENFYNLTNLNLPVKEKLSEQDLERKVKEMQKEMLKAAADLEFEKAATIRDQIKKLIELWGS